MVRGRPASPYRNPECCSGARAGAAEIAGARGPSSRVALNALRSEVHTESLTPVPRVERYTKVTFEPPSSSNAEHLLLSGIEAYIQERLDAVLRSRLVTPGTVEVESEPAPSPQ